MSSDESSRAAAQALLNIIAPGSTLVAIRPFADDHHNDTLLVVAQLANDESLQVVVKRYVNNTNVAVRARLEFDTLTWLQNHGVPVPPPLVLDDTGTILGTPGIVTRFVSGHQLMLPTDHPLGSHRWLEAMAHMLAKIHSVPSDPHLQTVLQADHSDVLWFLRDGNMPEYMQAHPRGKVVWDTILNQLPHLTPVQPTFTHTDFWPGNILWDQGRIAAVMDWEEAAYSNPGADVAYCRMDLILNGLNEAADEFLRLYETAIGTLTRDLGFWELVASVRPMHSAEGWISDSPMKERFQKFVDDAVARSSRA